jgi:putative ABC transport system permease protein
MSVIKRGFLYITRKRGRSILLLAIMLTAGLTAMLGLAVRSSADRQADAVRRSLAGSFILEADWEAVKELADDYGTNIPEDKRPKNISRELLHRIMDMEYFTNWFHSSRMVGIWFDLELRPGLYEDEYQDVLKNPKLQATYHETLDELTVRKQDDDIYGCNNSELQEYFRMGAFTLSQGRHIREDDVNKVIISSGLAARNHLSLGDSITAELREGFSLAGGDLHKRWGDPFKLQIVGIFDVNFQQEPTVITDESGETWVNTLENNLAENMIFSDLSTIKQMLLILGEHYGNKKDPSFYDGVNEVTLFVDDPKNLEAAMNEVKSLKDIDWKYYTVKPDDSSYRASVKPLSQLRTISAVLIGTAVMGCAALLCLLMNMWIKSRRREIGILQSAGVGRKLITLQMLFESTTIAVAALALSVLASFCLAGSFGKLSEGFVSPKNNEATYVVDQSPFEPDIEKVSADPVNLTYSLSAQNILFAAAAVLGSTALSAAVTARNITKLKPKDVMSAV